MELILGILGLLCALYFALLVSIGMDFSWIWLVGAVLFWGIAAVHKYTVLHSIVIAKGLKIAVITVFVIGLLVFVVALLLSGISSSITAGMAGGTIFSGIFNKPYDTSSKETKLGILVTMVPAAVIILFISSPFQGLIYSQMLLAVQLPITIFTQICLTSSKRVMGRYANSRRLNIVLWITALTVTFLNIGLFITGF